jgi:hypothetical protein
MSPLDERKANLMNYILMAPRPARWLYRILFHLLSRLALGS